MIVAQWTPSTGSNISSSSPAAAVLGGALLGLLGAPLVARVAGSQDQPGASAVVNVAIRSTGDAPPSFCMFTSAIRRRGSLLFKPECSKAQSLRSSRECPRRERVQGSLQLFSKVIFSARNPIDECRKVFIVKDSASIKRVCEGAHPLGSGGTSLRGLVHSAVDFSVRALRSSYSDEIVSAGSGGSAPNVVLLTPTTRIRFDDHLAPEK